MKNEARNSQYMKMVNRSAVLKIISGGKVFRAEIARQTNLTRAAVTNIVNELIEDGIVIETETGESDFGRKPVILDINEDCYYALGLYLSRGGCSAGLVNLKGSIIAKKDIDISKAHNANDAMDIIAENINSYIMQKIVDSNRILGLGVSAPGPLDSTCGIILEPPNFEMWNGVNIVEEMSKRLNMEVLLENNSLTMALAEKNYGMGKSFNSFMLMIVDTGIGAGIIVDNKLYKGEGGFGCEVGHASININGKKCSCGNRGCLEMYASIPSIIKTAASVNINIKTWENVVDGAVNNDDFCRKIIKKEALYLSSAIVNVQNILELEAVILTGYIRYKPEILLDNIVKMANKKVITRKIKSIKIYVSSLPQDIDVVSAAAIILDKFFRCGGLKL